MFVNNNKFIIKQLNYNDNKIINRIIIMNKIQIYL